MSDRWLKPDFQEMATAGECTAYAGTPGACEANNHGFISVDPLKEGRRSALLANAQRPINHGDDAVDPFK